MRARTALAGTALACLAIAACGTSSTVAHQAVRPKPSATFNARAAEVKACNDILRFENGNSQNTFGNDPASAQAELDAENTPLEVSLQQWVNDLQYGTTFQATQLDADNLAAICGSLGIAIFTTTQ